MGIVNSVKGFVRSISGIPPITLENCVDDKSVINYQIFGNSVQDGEPSPDNPIEVESVGEKTKNLLDESLFLTVSSVSKTEDGYYSKVYSLPIPGFRSNLKAVLKPNTIYTCSRIYTGRLNASNGLITIRYKKEDGTYVTKQIVPPGLGFKSRSFSFDTQEQIDNIDAMYFYFDQEGATISNVQLVEGEYAADTIPAYEPYGYKIPVTARGKNLVNYKDFIVAGKTKEIDNGIQFEATGSRIEIVKYIILKANTRYVLSAECTEDAYIGGGINIDSDGSIGFRWCTKSVKKYVVKNNTNVDREVDFYFIDTKGTKGSTIKFAMFEISETVTEYEPYVEPVTTNIYLDEPLKENEYIDFKKQKLYSDEIESTICLPNLPTFKGTTIYEINTTTQPSNMVVEYYSTTKGE